MHRLNEELWTTTGKTTNYYIPVKVLQSVNVLEWYRALWILLTLGAIGSKGGLIQIAQINDDNKYG